MKSPGCDHCSHPLFAGIKCDICGWEASQLHTCSYSCTRPACVLAQRDELRAKLEDSQDAANKFANFKAAYDEWIEKTEWVRDMSTLHELGMHRADVIKGRFDYVRERAGIDEALMRQALDALEQSETTVPYDGFGMAHREAERKHQAAITALRGRLEETK